jgi:hypothetical protein
VHHRDLLRRVPSHSQQLRREIPLKVKIEGDRDIGCGENDTGVPNMGLSSRQTYPLALLDELPNDLTFGFQVKKFIS